MNPLLNRLSFTSNVTADTVSAGTAWRLLTEVGVHLEIFPLPDFIPTFARLGSVVPREQATPTGPERR